MEEKIYFQGIITNFRPGSKRVFTLYKKYKSFKKIFEILEKNLNLIDGVVLVKSEEAIKTTKFLAKNEGIFAGISSGANVFASLKVSKILGKNKNVVTILPDRGERYFSKDIFK